MWQEKCLPMLTTAWNLPLLLKKHFQEVIPRVLQIIPQQPI